MFYSSTLSSQNIFTQIDPSIVQYDGIEQQRIANYIGRDNIEENFLVSLSDFQNVWTNGIYEFYLPQSNELLIAETIEYKEINDTGGFEWTASLNNEMGSLHISSTGNFTTGYIQTISSYYSLEPVKEHLSILIKHANIASGPETCGTSIQYESSGNAAASTANCAESEDDCSAVISIGVLMTPEALDWLSVEFGGDPTLQENYIQTGLKSLEHAFWNSNIYNKSIRYELIPYNNFPLSTSIFDDRDYLSNLLGPGIRSTNELDLLVLLTDDRYPIPGDPDGLTFAGIANGLIPFIDNAYAIITINNLLTPRYTLAHELGHLFGARHSLESDDDAVFCGHGYRFLSDDGLYKRTVMAFNTGLPDGTFVHANRILNFSNPNVEFNGSVTGDDWAEDNARVLNNTACDVADHYPTEEMVIGIQGPSAICNTQEEFTAQVIAAGAGIQGQPPFSYHWAWNTTGLFGPNSNEISLGNSNSNTISIGGLACNRFYLSLTVTSSDGVEIKTVRKIVSPCVVCPPELRLQQAKDEGIFPNPSNGKFTLQLHTVSIGKNSNIIIQDVNGRVVKKIDKFPLNKTANQIVIDLSNNQAGIYFCHLTTTTEQRTFKLIKL